MPAPNESTAFWLGVTLAVVGNALIAMSLTLQKLAHNKAAERGVPPHTLSLFWIGLVGMLAGEIGNFAAFGLATPTVVAPLGAVSVMVAAILAVAYLHEPFDQRSLAGVGCILFGALVVVLSAPPARGEVLDPQRFVSLLGAPAAIAYVSTVLLAVAVLGALQATRFGERHVLVPLGLCSLLGSITVLCASAFVQFIGRLIGAADIDQLRTPAFYLVAAVLVATGVLQVYFLQEALHHHDSTTVVPVYYMTFTLAAIAMPGVVYRDFWRFDARSALTFSAGVALCFLGVFLIISAGYDRDHRPLARERWNKLRSALSALKFLDLLDERGRGREKGGMLWFVPGASMWWNYFRMRRRGSCDKQAASSRSVGAAVRGAADGRAGYGTISSTAAAATEKPEQDRLC